MKNINAKQLDTLTNQLNEVMNKLEAETISPYLASKEIYDIVFDLTGNEVISNGWSWALMDSYYTYKNYSYDNGDHVMLL